jgi:ubiquinone/menaquinone biosynthesis C-methylase UbiE/uncharacterized protein YbaR (Trm112 family)
MIDLNLITTILRCPVTHQPLRVMSASEIESANRRIAAGNLYHHDGSPIRRPIEQGLIEENRRFAYFVNDGIIILLSELAIDLLEGESQNCPVTALRPEKKIVQNYYNQLGWHSDSSGRYVDTRKFADKRDVMKTYGQRCARRLCDQLPPGGEFLLDAASGPLHHTKNLKYQEGFRKRVCVDISLLALQEARNRLGDAGIYLLADITNLPLRNDTMDAAQSLHTIYHVPADEQILAIRELHRVLKKEGAAVVVYSWGLHCLPMRIVMLPIAFLNFLPKRIRILARFLSRPKSPVSPAPVVDLPLYRHMHRWRYFRRRKWGFPFEIRVWRSISTQFSQTYIHTWLGGRWILNMIFRLENCFPFVAGRWGQYPMFVIRK